MTVRSDTLNLGMETGANPYLLDGYSPVDTEITSGALEVIGEIPPDVNGLYVRNGPNPKYAPVGRYHWFDGDGMLHAVHLRDGTATYRNRWVRTAGFGEEVRAGEPLWTGIIEPKANPDDGSRLRLKDGANTECGLSQRQPHRAVVSRRRAVCDRSADAQNDRDA